MGRLGAENLELGLHRAVSNDPVPTPNGRQPERQQKYLNKRLSQDYRGKGNLRVVRTLPAIFLCKQGF